MDLYHQQILDLYKHPLNKGTLPDADWKQHEVNPTCGDEITVYLRFSDYSIAEITHDGQGCAISQASASLLTDELRGKTVDEAASFTKEGVVDMLGITLSPTRLKCALLPLQAVTRGIAAYRTDHGK